MPTALFNTLNVLEAMVRLVSAGALSIAAIRPET